MFEIAKLVDVACCSDVLPEMVTAPANVEVTDVLVANNAPTEGVEVPMTRVPSKERTEELESDVALVPPLAIASIPEIVARERHVPLTDRHPPERLSPLANVLVAVVDDTLNKETDSPPEKVDVAVVVAFTEPK